MAKQFHIVISFDESWLAKATVDEIAALWQEKTVQAGIDLTIKIMDLKHKLSRKHPIRSKRTRRN